MQENSVIIKNLRVNYKTIGEGKPFLILHGWGSNSEKWIKIGELLAETRSAGSGQENYKVIIPDLPGFGKSEEPTNAWSLDNYVDWLLEFSDAVPELKNQFYIAGHSFGGALASKFSIKYVQRVSKLFLISAACVRKRTAIKKIWYRLAKMFKIFSGLPLYQRARKGFYKYIIKKSDYPYQSGAMKETYLKIILDDLSYRVRFIRVPTFIIWGDKDESTPIDEARWLNNRILRSKLIIIDGADHLLHIKVPEVLIEKIISNL